MARARMKLDLKKNQLHKDVGKEPGVKLTEDDIAKEKSKGGVFAKRAQFAENAKKWKHPARVNASEGLAMKVPPDSVAPERLL